MGTCLSALWPQQSSCTLVWTALSKRPSKKTSQRKTSLKQTEMVWLDSDSRLPPTRTQIQDCWAHNGRNWLVSHQKTSNKSQEEPKQLLNFQQQRIMRPPPNLRPLYLLKIQLNLPTFNQRFHLYRRRQEHSKTSPDDLTWYCSSCRFQIQLACCFLPSGVYHLPDEDAYLGIWVLCEMSRVWSENYR